jgi:signal transduction histidine kinase
LRRDIWLICEAINNIVKYSECKNALLRIDWQNKVLCIHIEDDGKGFDIDQALNKSRSGLKNMRARTEKYKNGMFKIASGAGGGTAIDCCLPVKNSPKM